MEQLVEFLTSQQGKILCYVMLFLGIMDIGIVRIVLGRNIKKLEQTISPAMSLEKRQPIEKQIQGLQMTARLTISGGLGFIALAIFGLTR